jgi:hypothetical protein
VSTRCWPRSALPAVGRLLDLMARVKVAELTTPEVQGLVAVFEAADQRENAGTAPVLALIAGDSEVGQP